MAYNPPRIIFSWMSHKPSGWIIIRPVNFWFYAKLYRNNNTGAFNLFDRTLCSIKTWRWISQRRKVKQITVSHYLPFNGHVDQAHLIWEKSYPHSYYQNPKINMAWNINSKFVSSEESFENLRERNHGTNLLLVFVCTFFTFFSFSIFFKVGPSVSWGKAGMILATGEPETMFECYVSIIVLAGTFHDDFEELFNTLKAKNQKWTSVRKEANQTARDRGSDACSKTSDMSWPLVFKMMQLLTLDHTSFMI